MTDKIGDITLVVGYLLLEELYVHKDTPVRIWGSLNKVVIIELFALYALLTQR